MTDSHISRRALLASSAAAFVGCRRKKATGYPGYCFVANQGSRSVAAVDLNRFRVQKQIPLDAAPGAILTRSDPQSPRAFALAPSNGALYEIDPVVLTVLRRTHAGQQALGMQISPRNDALWVLCREPAALVEIPFSSFRPARRIALPGRPDDFHLSSNGKAAVASSEGRSVTVASLESAKVEKVIDVEAEASLVRFRADGKMLMAGSYSGRSVTMLDAVSGRTVVTLPLPVAPRRLCLKPDGGELYVTGDGMDAVVIVFPYTTEIEQTLLAGHAPDAMAVTDGNVSPGYLLAANPASDTVTALDLVTRRLVAVVRVGQGPREILFTPDGQYALVLNERSGDMAVIRRIMLEEPWVRRYKSGSLFTSVAVGDRPVSAGIVQVG